jgi:mono/diheme cytochrome c family protein
MKSVHLAVFCAALAGFAATPSLAADPPSGTYEKLEGNPVAGRRYAVRMCAQCHDVVSRSENADADISPPGFHAVANARTTTGMGLNVFLQSPHTDMPNLIISRRDRRDVIAYILSLRDAQPTAE